jgi:enolase
MAEQINFDSLNMKISELLKTYPIEQQQNIFQYLSEMDEHRRKAYDIAYCHLGTSFSIARSNGFKEWLAHKNPK